MLIRNGESRGRMKIITNVERLADPPPSRTRPDLRITTWRGNESVQFNVASDGIRHRGALSLGVWARASVYSFIVITHPSACSVFFVLQDERDAPQWTRQYMGFWDDAMDEAMEITPKLSECQPAVERVDPLASARMRPLEVKEIGTSLRRDSEKIVVDTLREIGYRVELMTWDEYHRGEFPWKAGQKSQCLV